MTIRIVHVYIFIFSWLILKPIVLKPTFFLLREKNYVVRIMRYSLFLGQDDDDSCH